MNTVRFISACRSVIFPINRSIVKSVCLHQNSVYLNRLTQNIYVNTRKMSQKSITSFFKITPKKEKNETNEEKELKESASSPTETSKVEVKSNGTTKKSNKKRTSSEESSSPEETKKKSPSPVVPEKRSKRLRSSSEESASPKSEKKSVSPENVEKKKKVKRQRIESSESEPEAAESKEDEQEEIRVERSATPKTYDSPKSRKTRAKKMIPEKKIKVEKKSPKLEKISPKVDKISPKAERMSPEVEKMSSEEDNLSPEEEEMSPKLPKKTSKKSPKKEVKKSGNLMSMFTVKREKVNGDKKEADKENSIDNEDNQKTVEEADYDPAKNKYHPIKDACWKKDQPVPYLALAKTLEAIEATSARLKMVEILSNYFRSVIALTPEDLLASIYLCLNQLAPAYHSLELGIAETYLMKAVGQCTGRTVAQLRSAAQRVGDLGQVAQTARATQRTMFAPPPLSARRVLAALKEIASMTGHASVNKKIAKIQSLYVACRHSEARYLIRSLEGKLRVGLAEQSVLQALAQASARTPPAGERAGQLDVAAGMSPDGFKALVDEYALIIKTTYCECPNYELLVPVLLQHGARALPQHCRLTPGIPLKPMLAHPTRGVGEVFTRFENEEFTCEWKYDGERAQIHVPGEDAPALNDAAIFSRNQENNTSKYPDVLKRLPSLLKDSVTSCVLDCEAVAYDVAAKQILPFQILSTRKRKDASEADIKVQVCVFVFDLLFLNGRALVREPLEQRRRLLREHFNEVEGEWKFAVGRDCKDTEEVEAFLHEAISGCCEGLMVKALRGEHARYDIARRSHNWLKLKKDYLEGVGDTIDVVVIGGYKGRGKRAGAFGGFLLACYDPATESYQSLCKIGTGFSDEDLKTLSETLNEHVIDGPKNYYMYDQAHAPDAWFSASRVWEVRCADLSLSPAHRAAAGLADPEKGVSLRFPRFIRERDDKTPEQATSAQQIAAMYSAQDTVKASAKQQHLDDFY